MRAFVRASLACLVMGGAIWVLLDVLVWHGPLHTWLLRGREGVIAAEVAGEIITRQDLEMALREHLWQRAQTWDSLSRDARERTRQTVLDNLIDARLVRASRLREKAAGQGGNAPVRLEAERLQRQFVTPGDYQGRLAGQGHTQKSMEAMIQDAQFDEAWLLENAGLAAKDLSTDEARAWYDRNKETLRIPPACRVAHLFLARGDKAGVDRAAEIRGIQGRLVAGGESFAALVQKYSEDARTKSLGGDLGWVTRQRMPADFMAAVEKVSVGQTTAPVTTALGWHLIRVLERRPSRVPAFEEAQAEITAWLITRRREKGVARLLTDLRQRFQSAVVLHPAVIAQAAPAP